MWSFLFLAMVSWQGWMTLALFAPDSGGPDTPRLSRAFLADAWHRLCNEEPILSGRHALHLYHGYLGALSMRERETACCFDPAFQAGYPKTPVFDGGSHPAELFLSLVGGEYNPAAYKIGLAICLLAIPFFLFVAAWASGLGPGASCLATAFGLLACWGRPGRDLVEAGDLDLMLALLAGLVQTGLLLRFDRHSGLWCALGLLACGCLGWFAQPSLFAASYLLVLVYYLAIGSRHPWNWHAVLWGALLGGLLLNGVWLLDWFTHWWIRLPLRLSVPLLPHRTLPTIWGASLWGETPDRVLTAILVTSGALGLWQLHAGQGRPAARLFFLGGGGLLVLAIAGMAWEPLGTFGTTHLLVPALWFTAIPAAHAFARTALGLSWLLGGSIRALAVVGAALAVLVTFSLERAAEWTRHAANGTPLILGLNEDQQLLVARLREHTTMEGRILLEDHPGVRAGTHWSALLPVLTQRSYIGGLDLDRCIEHAYPNFSEQTLAGRPLADWPDAELAEFTRRYAIGWAACWSPAAIDRFRAWPAAEMVEQLPGQGYLFRLGPPSYALRGQATLVQADCRRIVFQDVVPDAHGKVVLSLHFQEGMRAIPSRVQVEREPDAHDPIPFVRLRLPGPVARVTLLWEGR